MLQILLVHVSGMSEACDSTGGEYLERFTVRNHFKATKPTHQPQNTQGFRKKARIVAVLSPTPKSHLCSQAYFISLVEQKVDRLQSINYNLEFKF